MQRTVVWKRFRALLTASVILNGVDYAAGMAECIIAGEFLGGEAVAGITLLSPVMPFLTFIGMLIVSGSMTLFSYASGRADEEDMNRCLSQAMTLCVGVGLFLTLAMFMSKDLILAYWDVSEEIATHARAYFDGIAVRPPIYFLTQILISLLLVEGEVKRSLIAAATQFSVTVAASVFLCPHLGALGLSLGTTLGFTADLFVKGSYLFSKKCKLRPTIYVSAKKALEMLRLSFGMALADLWMALLPFAMTSYILAAFGEDALIVFGVINSIMSVSIAVFQGVEQTMQPMVCLYSSEGNLCGLRKIMKISAGASLAVGAVLSAVFMASSGSLPGLFGATNPSTAKMATTAIIAFVPFLAARSLAMTYAAYFAYRDDVFYAAFLQMLIHLALPFSFAVGVGSAFGFTGVWAGLGASSLAALFAGVLLSRFAVWKSKGKLAGLLMLDREVLASQFSFDFLITQDEIMETSHRVEKELLARNIDADKSRKTAFFVEELGMNAVERQMRVEGTNASPCEAEVTVTAGDTITLVLRDAGEVVKRDEDADITNIDGQLSSFRMFVVSQMASKLDYRSYIMIGGENRTMLRI